MTLRLKIFSLNLLTVLFAIGVVVIAGNEIVRKTIYNTTYEKLTQIRNFKAQELQKYFGELKIANNLLTKHSKIRKLFSTPIHKLTTLNTEDLDEYAKAFNLYDLIVLDKDNRFLYTYRKKVENGTALVLNYTNRRLFSSFQKALHSPPGTLVISEFKQDPFNEDTHTAVICTPVYRRGTVVGVVISKIELNTINQITKDKAVWAAFERNISGEILLFNESWKTVNVSLFNDLEKYISSETDNLKQIGNLNKDYFLANHQLTDLGIDYKGNEVLRSTAKIRLPDGKDWIISAKINKNEAFNSILQVTVAISLAAVLTIFATSIVTFISSKLILKPIQLLTERLDEIGPGNLPEKISYAGEDEIGTLIDKYNNLSTRLATTTISRDFQDKLFQSLNCLVFIITSKKSHENGNTYYKIINYNECALNSLKFSPEELKSIDFKDLIVDDQNIFELSKILVTQKEAEVYLRGAHNKLIPVLMHWNHIISKNPFESTIVLTCTDISERIKNERDLISAREQALKASKAKSEFLARMSHEIRTPLNAIIGINDILSEEPLKPHVKDMLNVSSTAGENLLALINDILDISKIEAQEVKIESIPFDIINLVKSTAEILKQKAIEKNIDFNLVLADDLSNSISILGDPTRIRQVLFNLIGNAIKFTLKGSVDIILDLDLSGKYFVFQIKDTGTGISQETQKNLFQSFNQADSSITRRFGGTGLGLTISKNLVELMGGKIWYESQVDAGSTFYFSIPLIIAPEIQVQSSHSRKYIKSEGKKRILIVDDVSDNRFLIKKFLSNLDFEIYEAGDGASALELIENQIFDLVLMDIQMPVMDGYIATKHIRLFEKTHPHRPRTKVVAISANAMTDDIQKSFESGCDGYLTKPIKKIKLLEAVYSYLHLVETSDTETTH